MKTACILAHPVTIVFKAVTLQHWPGPCLELQPPITAETSFESDESAGPRCFESGTARSNLGVYFPCPALWRHGLRPSTTWITFRRAVLSFCRLLSLKIACRVSEQEQLRFTNNDEACHASFTIHHPGAVPGRWSVLHKNQLSVKYTSLQCLLLWSPSAALYSKSRLRCDITVYHCPAQWGLHWEWVQCTPDEVSKLSYVGIWLLYGDSFCFPNTES